MQRAMSVARAVRVITPKQASRVVCASFQHASFVNAAVAEDATKASASLKRE